MRLMDGVCIFVAELVEDGTDPLVIFGSHQLSNDPFKPAAGCEYKFPIAGRRAWTGGTTYSRAPCFRLS